MRRWLKPALTGLSTDEVDHLTDLGYGRWLEKKKLTAPMIVALIEHSLLFLEAFAEERARHPADERARMIDLLNMMVATSHSDDEDAKQYLKALRRLDRIVAERGGPHYTLDSEGLLAPMPEPKDVAQTWKAVQQRFPALTTQLRNQITKQNTTERSIQLADDNTIVLGTKPRYEPVLQQFRVELGETYLKPTTTLHARAAQVRKWKELLWRRTLRA
jgi:hypothetical protein